MPQISRKQKVLQMLNAIHDAEKAGQDFGFDTSYQPLPRISGFLEDDMRDTFEEESENLGGWDTLDIENTLFNAVQDTPDGSALETKRRNETPARTISVGLSDEFLNHLNSTRYWDTRGPYLPTIINVESWFHQPRFENNDRKFRKVFRMNREIFYKLLEKIECHSAFQNQSTSAKQTPVKYQLAIFLYRLGSKGGGGSLEQVGDSVGVGVGTVLNFSRRVMRAILSLLEQYICWPSKSERDIHKQRVCSASTGVFAGCIGFVDGTFITLAYAPLKDWFYYFNRKSSYALNAMVVCNDNRRILYIRAGDTSAVHDARIFDNSQLAQHPDEYFADGEYLIGDSAYSCTSRMIVPFKKPRSKEFYCRLFNSTLSSRRIAIEHTFGMLKARFPSITSVAIHITGPETHKEVVDWFESACILHNFLLDENDLVWDDDDDMQMAVLHQEMVEQQQQEVLRREDGKGRGEKRLRNEEILRESILEHIKANVLA